jgi:L-lactate dehydrogenase complex protein LldG
MSREKILARVKASQPIATDNLELDDIAIVFEDIKGVFINSVELAGGACLEVQSEADILNYIQSNHDQKTIYNGLSDNGPLTEDPHEVETLDFAVFKSELAVAENGAIYLSFTSDSQRSAPFLTQVLGLVVRPGDIVSNMVQAYQNVEEKGLEAYGVFISGPSKTADIEQCLVKGAHGACELVVFLLND